MAKRLLERALAALGLVAAVNVGLQAAPVLSVSAVGIAAQATASAAMFDGMEVDDNGDVWLVHSGDGGTAKEHVGNING